MAVSSVPKQTTGQLSFQTIFRTWWPLAFSWLLMSVEIPVINAVIARLAEPKVNLAAYGIIYNVSLIIEAPVVMLLGASVALSRSRQAYQLIWRYMMISGFILTLVHGLVAFTPLFHLVVRDIIGAPEEILEPARLGLMIMLPWTWAIGYRRFQQGVMIRNGYSGAVGAGTIIRLIADALVLGACLVIGGIPGAAVGATAQAVGVVVEALYAGWRVRPVLRAHLQEGQGDDLLTWGAFGRFYIPLALTSLISLMWSSIGSAALSRMPNALDSLAVWTVLSGMLFVLRSFGIAYNEVVVALLDRQGSWPSLRAFGLWMAAATGLLHLLLAGTPLLTFIYVNLSAVPLDLLGLAVTGFWMALPIGPLSVFQNWFQGSILYGRNTRAVPESVTMFFVVVLSILGVGVLAQRWTGLYVGVLAFVLANTTQMIWLGLRSRSVMQKLAARDRT